MGTAHNTSNIERAVNARRERSSVTHEMKARPQYRVAQNDEPEPGAFLTGLVMAAAMAPVDAMQLQREAYVTLLKRHDWSHEHSDDFSVYTRGREALAELRMVQRAIDGDFSIWNQHAPTLYRNGAVAA